MIREFEKLNSEERQLLYRAPVLVSVLSSCSGNRVNQTKMNDAIRLAHLRTFTANPSLLAYYHEVEKIFKTEFEHALNNYYPFDEIKRSELKKEISRVNKVIGKLTPAYAEALNDSLRSYARHVKKSVHSVFTDFIFPITYSGLNK